MYNCSNIPILKILLDLKILRINDISHESMYDLASNRMHNVVLKHQPEIRFATVQMTSSFGQSVKRTYFRCRFNL